MRLDPNDVVGSGGLTRLEAALAERRDMMHAELKRHNEAVQAEYERHRQAMDHIDSVVNLRLGKPQ